jgi:hypothetical protein
VTHDSIQLKWSELQCRGQSVEFYTLYYCESKEPPDLPQWKEIKLEKTKPFITVDNLAAQTKYSFRVQAQLKTGHISSDVSGPISTDPHPVPPGKPSASNVTHNSLVLEWSKPQYGGQSVESYTVLYCERNAPRQLWKELRHDSPEQSVHRVDDLSSQTVYLFKVQAQFKARVICSEVSDPIETHSPPVPPGKPIAFGITESSIQLKWSKAEWRRRKAEFYSIFYRENTSGHWKTTNATEELITLSGLTPGMGYCCKIRAVIAGMQIDSEISDPIQTYPIKPGKPTASSKTHNSITLEWSEAQYRALNASYTVSCCDTFGEKKLKLPHHQ